MAGVKINEFGNGDNNVGNMQVSTDAAFKGQIETISITELYTDAVPKITAGSVVENSGALFEFAIDEAIATTDPYTSLTVSDGRVYIIMQPSGSTITAAFTSTPPVWSDAKQGWYGITGEINSRYLPWTIEKAGAVYSEKRPVLYRQDSRDVYHVSDATERSTVSTAWANEGNLSLTFTPNYNEIWEIILVGNSNSSNINGLYLSLILSAGTGNLYVDADVNLFAGETRPFAINGGTGYLTNTQQSVRGLFIATSTASITIQMRWLKHTNGTAYVKDRKLIARKIA